MTIINKVTICICTHCEGRYVVLKLINRRPIKCPYCEYVNVPRIQRAKFVEKFT